MVIYPGPRGIIGASRSKIVLYYGKTVAPNAVTPGLTTALTGPGRGGGVSPHTHSIIFVMYNAHTHMQSVSKLINH